MAGVAICPSGWVALRRRRKPVRVAFLEGYRSRAAALLPQDEASGRMLLESMELEKLLYELRYEVGHRPDWVEIPARDLPGEER